MYTFQKDTNIRKYRRNRQMDLHTGFGCKSGRYRDIVKREKKKKSKLYRVSNQKLSDTPFQFSFWTLLKNKQNDNLFFSY